MKLHELANVVSKGNATTLTGGPLPNAFTDDSTKQSLKPRKKKKDAYGVGYVYPHSYSNPYNGDDSSSGGDSGGGDGGGGD